MNSATETDGELKVMESGVLRQSTKASASALMAGSIASPWPARDVVKKLLEATRILLDDKGYDGHGYEEICAARDEAAKWMKQ